MAVAKLGADEMYCFSCGSIIKKAAEICVKCGVRIAEATSSDEHLEFSDRSRLAAGILGILLGFLGVHRFYLGNIGIGIIQIVVTVVTFGFGSLWGLIEGIIIIAGGGWRDADGRPLKKYGQ